MKTLIKGGGVFLLAFGVGLFSSNIFILIQQGELPLSVVSQEINQPRALLKPKELKNSSKSICKHYNKETLKLEKEQQKMIKFLEENKNISRKQKKTIF